MEDEYKKGRKCGLFHYVVADLHVVVSSFLFLADSSVILDPALLAQSQNLAQPRRRRALQHLLEFSQYFLGAAAFNFLHGVYTGTNDLRRGRPTYRYHVQHLTVFHQVGTKGVTVLRQVCANTFPDAHQFRFRG